MIHPQSYQVIHLQSYQVIHPRSSQVIHQQASQAPAVSLQSSTNPIQVDSSLVAPYFLPTDDPLECLNNALTLMSTILALSYPSSNNQLEISSNPMHQVAMPERQTLSYVGNSSTDCDDVLNAQPSFMANILSYGLDALAESSVINHSETEITSDSNIIPYSHQVINCTKINLDNKSVNDSLTAELERYKEQVKVLKEGQNVDLKSKDNILDSCEQSVEIDRLKQILSEHVKEKESLMQTVSLLKNDFKKEESRNIDREIALEKKIKQLDNIKAQQLEPKLYDGNVIKNTSAIVIPDSEETLVLAEESRSKMLLKQQDPMMLEKKVNTTPVDYAALNQLSQDFETRFVPQTELSTEQAFWSQNSMNSSDPSPSCRPTKVEVPKELPKVSMVNTKVDTQLNQEIFQRDNSVSNQSAPSFDQYFELNELKAQSQEKDTVIKKLKERIKSLSGNMNEDKVKKDIEEIETINIELDHRVSKLIAENEHLKQTYKQLYDSIKPTRIRSKEQCDALVNQVNQKSVEISNLNVQISQKSQENSQK
ncbi:hypothetical protein Tco_0502490 [Tanacetum coccineum]